MGNCTVKTFTEKLDLLLELFMCEDMRVPEKEIEKAEERLHIHFPKALKEFYLRVGKGGNLLESQNTIFTPKELLNYTAEDEDAEENEDLTEEELLAKGGDLVLAEENQAVWFCRLDSKTQKTYLDWGEGERVDWEMSLEDTLLFLLTLNMTTSDALCGAAWEPQDTDMQLDEVKKIIADNFLLLVEGEHMVFVDVEQKVLGCQMDEQMIAVATLDEDVLEEWEEQTGIALSWW